MQREHYLEAISRAIELYQQELDAAHELLSADLRAIDVRDTDRVAVARFAFTVRQAKALSSYQSRSDNLAKWPLV